MNQSHDSFPHSLYGPLIDSAEVCSSRSENRKQKQFTGVLADIPKPENVSIAYTKARKDFADSIKTKRWSSLNNITKDCLIACLGFFGHKIIL